MGLLAAPSDWNERQFQDGPVQLELVASSRDRWPPSKRIDWRRATHRVDQLTPPAPPLDAPIHRNAPPQWAATAMGRHRNEPALSLYSVFLAASFLSARLRSARFDIMANCIHSTAGR